MVSWCDDDEKVVRILEYYPNPYILRVKTEALAVMDSIYLVFVSILKNLIDKENILEF